MSKEKIESTNLLKNRENIPPALKYPMFDSLESCLNE